MKNSRSAFFVVLAVLFLLFSVVPASAETETAHDLAVYLADFTVYCKHWNDTVGKEYGIDISYDSDRMTVIKAMLEGFSGGTMDLNVADYDGIIAETDWNYNVYSLRANTIPDNVEKLYSISRVSALINAVAYDFPSTERQMTERFIETMNLYMDFLSANVDEILDGNAKTMTVKTSKGEFDFNFVFMDDGIYICYGSVNYPYNTPDNE